MAVLAVYSFLTACESLQEAKSPSRPNNTADVSTYQIGSSTLKSNRYKLRPMDELTFSVNREPDMSNLRLRVDADGSVKLPLVGRIEIGNLTLDQAMEKITALYAEDYFKDPDISMEILAYSKQSCYVNGSVNSPMEVIFPPEEADTMTITRVIAMCRGFNARANRTSVIVKRKFPDGKEQVYFINVKKILENPKAPDFPILNGDLIQVDEDIV